MGDDGGVVSRGRQRRVGGTRASPVAVGAVGAVAELARRPDRIGLGRGEGLERDAFAPDEARAKGTGDEGEMRVR